MFFDSHAHYEDSRFKNDRDEILQSLLENEISNVVNVGSNIKNSKDSIKIAEKYDFVYASVGVHPHDAKEMKDEDLSLLNKWCSHEKVVAIGEIGLDYHYDNSPREVQKQRFKEQLSLAREIDMPVIIHNRDAIFDTLSIMKEIKVSSGVMHCFSGSVETAREVLNLGYYISFAGPVTFRNARSLAEVAKFVPDDRFLIETDCPYLAPEPFRGKRNQSVYVKEIAKKLAVLRNAEVNEIAKITSNNAKTLFRIK